MKKRPLIIMSLLLVCAAVLFFFRGVLYPIIGSMPGYFGNPELCRNVTDKNSLKYYCYETVMKSIDSAEECDSMKDDFSVNGNWKHVCYTGVAERQKNKNICLKITDDEDIKSFCYSQVAVALLDEKVCDLATGPYRRGYCFYTLALKLQKPNLCFRAEEYKNGCFIELAYILKDVALCENVPINTNDEQESPKERCIRYSRGQKDPIMIQ